MDEKPVTWKFILTWVIIVAILVAAFELWQQSNRGRISKSTSHANYHEVVLVRGRDNHYRLDAYVNGVKVHFLLDTGASKVALPKLVAKKANVHGHVPIQVNTANGVTQATLSRINELTIGSIRLNNISTVIMASGGHIALLGMSALKKIEMINRGDKLILRQKR